VEHDKRVKWAQFRFSVIAPLVCRKLNEEQRRALRREILSQTFVTPDGHEKKMAPRTLTEWVTRHKRAGFDGLLDARRSTLGESRAIAKELLDRAEQLRREEETRSVRTILSLLRAEGHNVSGISKTTLNVHLNQRGVSKAQLSGGKGSFQRWEQERANRLWQADTSAGVWLPDPTDPKKLKQTRLITFVDDATRVCTHGEFYWDEKLPSLVDCFRKALLKRGKPERLLCDNAFIYHSTTVAIMCAQLNIEVSFCTEYYPPSKGKVEKHYGTIKGSFYKEAEHSGLTTLDELNQFFFAWLTKEYHHVKHSALSVTPIERWRQDEQGMLRVSPEDIRRALMLRAKRKVNSKTALIRLDNRTYQASPELAGRNVEVRWHARDEHSVELWHDGRLIEIAVLSIPGTNIDFSRRHKPQAKPRGLTFESSKKYRHVLVAEHDGESPLPTSAQDDYLAQSEFADLIARSLQRSLESAELQLLARFFLANSPLKDKATESLIAQAVSAKGTKMHLRYYLEHIRMSRTQTRR
jgi:putative transposase